MNPNQSNTPPAKTSEKEFNTEATAAEQGAQRKSRGHMVLGAIKGIFSKEKQPKSENYLLMERLPKDFRTANKGACKYYDGCGIDMPAELGEFIEALVNNPDYWIGVHHSDVIDNEAFEYDETLQSIMREGLKNYGDVRQGVINYRNLSGEVTHKDPAVSKTLRHCNNMFNTTVYLKTSYKGAGAVLAAIPSKYLNEDGDVKPGFEGAVYDHDIYGRACIKPEFMMGFVRNLGPGHKLEFKTRQEILEAANDQPPSENFA